MRLYKIIRPLIFGLPAELALPHGGRRRRQPQDGGGDHGPEVQCCTDVPPT